MSDIRFCPNCGEKRLNEAAFCVSCGSKFNSGGGIPLMLPATMVVAAVLTFLFVQFVILKEKPQAPAAAHDHANEHQATATSGADHHHDLPPEVQALAAKVEAGDVNAMIDLAEQQAALSSRDNDMLFHAGQTLEAFLSRFPSHGYALRLAGNVFYNLNMPEKAVLYYGLYLKLYPNDANVRTDYGTQLLAMGRLEDAVKAYEQAIETYPDFYNPHYNLYIAWSRLENEEKAQMYKAKAEEIDRRVGKKFAPEVNPPRYPGGEASPDTTHPPLNGDRKHPSDSGSFANLESYFRDHQIIGRKMTDFKVSGDKATLLVRQFPMDQMPPMVKDALSKKITARLTAIGPKAVCDIVDADNQKVLASYQAQAAPAGAAKQSPAAKADKFADLESWFRQHQIIGPKMAGFEEKGDHANLLVRAFPMSAMPPMVKDSLAKKITARLAQIGPKATLNIVDADSGEVMADYAAR